MPGVLTGLAQHFQLSLQLGLLWNREEQKDFLLSTTTHCSCCVARNEHNGIVACRLRISATQRVAVVRMALAVAWVRVVPLLDGQPTPHGLLLWRD